MKQPHDEAYHAILEAKYSRIISEISEMHDVSIEQAMDIFYTSELLTLLEDGVADLNCNFILATMSFPGDRTSRTYLMMQIVC